MSYKCVIYFFFNDTATNENYTPSPHEAFSIHRKTKPSNYKKIIRVSKKYLAHDADNTIAVGENVKIQETKPLSKNKSWEIIK